MYLYYRNSVSIFRRESSSIAGVAKVRVRGLYPAATSKEVQ